MAAAKIHSALQNLSPTTWSSVPRDPPSLGPYLTDIFTSAELLINTVPPPLNGTPFETALPQFTTPNAAKSAAEIHPSAARVTPPDASHAELQKHWGKAMKFPQKENPLNVALYKMAGHDRHGAWFARHQVVEGIGFKKFAAALRREFPETLLVQGAPGAGAKRGLSGDRRVERVEVDGVGRMEVYQLSAQMPSPVSPRDFLTLLLSTEKGLSGMSAAEKADGGKHVPRSYMIVSRPLEHPDAPARQSFVRGQYESVELIREIPLHVSKSTVDLNKEAEGETVDPELNPVEWIMITRSDPAGGVPRFLVDRGTPGAMLGDVTKFLNWACAFEEVPDADEDLELQVQKSAEMTAQLRGDGEGAAGDAEEGKETPAISEQTAMTSNEAPVDPAATPTRAATAPITTTTSGQQETSTGLVSNLGQAVLTGVDSYAPSGVSAFMHRQIDPDDDLSDSSDSSSLDSFLSAEEMKRMSTAPESPETTSSLPRASTENLSVASAADSSSTSSKHKPKLSQHEKDLAKITRKRAELDAKLAKKRETETSKLKSSAEKDEQEQEKARERMEKEMRKTEERHRREIEKLEGKKRKQEERQAERRRKREEESKLGAVVRERDEFRREADLLRRENGLLREQVEGLQRENTQLVAERGRARAGTGATSGDGSGSGSGSGEKV